MFAARGASTFSYLMSGIARMIWRTILLKMIFFVEQRCWEITSANGNLLNKMLPIFCDFAMCSIRNRVYIDPKKVDNFEVNSEL